MIPLINEAVKIVVVNIVVQDPIQLLSHLEKGKEARVKRLKKFELMELGRIGKNNN